MDITPRNRAKIVTLREHTTMSQRKIAETVGVSLGSVSSILTQKRETGNVEVQRKGRCKRKRKTTKRYDLTLLRKSKLNPRKTSEELKRDMDEMTVVCMRLHLPFDDDCWRMEGRREDQKRSNC